MRNDPQPKLPPEQVAINELRAEAKTPEDHAVLDEAQNELDQERAETLAHAGVAGMKLMEMPDGTLATQEDVKSIIDSGDMPLPPRNR